MSAIKKRKVAPTAPGGEAKSVIVPAKMKPAKATIAPDPVPSAKVAETRAPADEVDESPEAEEKQVSFADLGIIPELVQAVQAMVKYLSLQVIERLLHLISEKFEARH